MVPSGSDYTRVFIVIIDLQLQAWYYYENLFMHIKGNRYDKFIFVTIMFLNNVLIMFYCFIFLN